MIEVSVKYVNSEKHRARVMIELDDYAAEKIVDGDAGLHLIILDKIQLALDSIKSDSSTPL